MLIRPFTNTDIDQLLTVFQKNVPAAFGANERDEYAGFLRTNATADPYFVAVHNDQVVGACGHYIVQDGQIANVCWILSDPDVKGLGVGSTLLRHNLALIRQLPDVQLIQCRTSQVAYQFFEKFGFQLQYTRPDFWAPGLDLYFMTLGINDVVS